MELQRWQARPLGEATHRLGEGPHWDAERGRLSWVDIVAGELWVDEGDGEQRVSFGEDLGVAVPHQEGGWVCGLSGGIARVAEDGTLLHRVPLEPAGVRMNDGKCDSAGRFFVGSKAQDNAPGAGNLWRLDLDGTVSRVIEGLTIANGLGWSPDDQVMYVTDSAPGRIDAFRYDVASGALTERRTFLQAEEGDGSPDGLAVDAEGCLWVAFWAAGAVRRYAPDGRLVGQVDVPASLTTSCAFAGPALQTLVITSAWDELTEAERAEQPLAGRRFVAEVGVAGRPGQPCGVPDGPWAQAVAAS